MEILSARELHVYSNQTTDFRCYCTVHSNPNPSRRIDIEDDSQLKEDDSRSKNHSKKLIEPFKA